MKLVTTKFKSGGLHEKHVVATWNVGNHLSICFWAQGNQEKPVSRWPKTCVEMAISGTHVENTLSLTYRHKKKSRKVISGDRGGQCVGPSRPIHLYDNVASKNRRTCEPGVEAHHLVGTLSTAESLLTEVQRKFPTCPGKQLFVIRERL